MEIKVLRQLVKLEVSAEEGQLYRPDSEASQYAAKRLNDALCFAVSKSDDADQCLDMVFPAFDKERKFGSVDSEPMRVLDRVLERIYGEGPL